MRPANEVRNARIILLLGRGQMQRTKLRIERRALLASAVILVDHFPESRNTAVVHARRREGDLTKSGRLECAAIRRSACDDSASFIADHTGPPGDAGIVKLLVAAIPQLFLPLPHLSRTHRHTQF